MWDTRLKKSIRAGVRHRQAHRIKALVQLIPGISKDRIAKILEETGIGDSSLITPLTKTVSTTVKGLNGWDSQRETKNDIRVTPIRQTVKLYDMLTQLRKNGEIDDVLKETVLNHINKKIMLNTRVGNRHKRRYPISGRTRSNANTRKRWRI